MRIAVIGSGISGLASAYLLARRHEVVLYEKDARPGGHSHTFLHTTPTGEVAVDTGFIVFNPRNYPNLTALFAELDVLTRPTTMSFSVSLGQGAYEWCGSDQLWSVFAQPSNAFKRSHWRLIADILRLNRRARACLESGALPGGSLGEWLDRSGFSHGLRSRYLLPMAGMIWSCSPRQAADYPAADFMRFFDAHGLFTAIRQPQWYTVVGGSQRYVQRLLAAFGGRLALGAGVRQLRRGAQGVDVATESGSERFDQVVCAAHADQALRLLTDADDAERAALSGIAYTRNHAVLHGDLSFMPRRRAAWACWNYLHPADEVHDGAICGSYWMNRLQGLGSARPYLVTLNPSRAVDARAVLYETTYEHPHYTANAVATQRALPALQGRGGLWWAGAWTRYGFHEDGLASGLRAVAGIDPACLPAWAQL